MAAIPICEISRLYQDAVVRQPKKLGMADDVEYLRFVQPTPRKSGLRTAGAHTQESGIDTAIARCFLVLAVALTVVILTFAMIHLLGRVGTTLVLMAAAAGAGYRLAGRWLAGRNLPDQVQHREPSVPVRTPAAVPQNPTSPNPPPEPRLRDASFTENVSDAVSWPKADFYSRATILRFAGLRLRDPMVYFGSPTAKINAELSLIDPGLVVASDVTEHHERPAIRPTYAMLTAVQRRAYLVWLAGDRSDPSVPVGFLFMFLSGLERRVLFEGEDTDAVFRALLRLCDSYEDHHAEFRGAATNLAWHLVAVDIHQAKIAPRRVPDLIDRQSRWNDRELLTALAWLQKNSRPVPANLAWAVCVWLDGGRTARANGDKALDEFKRRWPRHSYAGPAERLQFASQPTPLRYSPANTELRKSNGVLADALAIEVPDALKVTPQFDAWMLLWRQCVGAQVSPGQKPGASETPPVRRVASQGRFRAEAAVGRDETASSSPALFGSQTAPPLAHPKKAAVERMPPTEATPLGAWATVCDAHRDAEFPSVWLPPVGELAATLGIPFSVTLTDQDTRRLSQAADRMGYTLEPDPRQSGRPLAWRDRIALFYPDADQDDFQPQRYGEAALLIHLSAIVGQADGTAHPAGVQLADEHVRSSFRLSRFERERLEIYRLWLQRTGPDALRLDRRRIGTLTKDQRCRIAQLLWSVAAADGVVTAAERQTLRRLCSDLDVDYAAIEAASLPGPFEGRQSSVIRPPDVAAVPWSKGRATGAFTLDRERLERVTEDTRAVATLLSEAMQPGAESDAAALTTTNAETPKATDGIDGAVPKQHSLPGSPRSEDGRPASEIAQIALVKDTRFEGISPRFASFACALVEREQWASSDLRRLADAHGVMVGAAVEAINQWSVERLGDWLIDDSNPEICVDASLLPPPGGTPS